MRQREFIRLLDNMVATAPLAAHAQEAAMPVIGLIHTGSPEIDAYGLVPSRQGINEIGYVEGQNMEYRIFCRCFT
jgi:putative tryptophan/tyrosine transport system substrate-binding protein